MKVQSIIAPKPGRISEDIVGSSGSTIWAIDGATPPDDPALHAATVSLVNDIDGAFKRALSESPNLPLRDLLAEGHRAAKGLMGRQEGHIPYATCAVVRLGTKTAQMAVLGDCVAAVICDGDARMKSDNRLKAVALQERAAVRALSADNVLEKSAAYRKARLRLIEEEARWRNKHGGYWVIAEDADASPMAIFEDIPLAEGKPVFALCMTDGFARIGTHLRSPIQLSELPDQIERDGLDKIVGQLRQDEEEFSYRRGLSSSMHDDASIIMLSR